jgi:predicted nucleic acid-binding protein
VSGRLVALDTSCMVAAVCAWHVRHAAAAAEIERRLDRGERLAIAAHAIAGTCAVLTRLPAPHRLSPADAWTLVRTNFIDNATLVTLDGPGHVAVLARLAGAGIGGGRTYDGLIGACAEVSHAKALLTFNPRHFDPPPRGVTIVEPIDPS